MRADAINPYALQSRMLWRNRVAEWRRRPREATFLALASLAGLGLLAAIIHGVLPGVTHSLVWLREQQPLAAAVVLLAAVLADQLQARRRQRRQVADDWLAAQPVATAVRQRLRVRALVLRLLLALVLMWVLLRLAGASAPASLLMTVGSVIAAALGNLLGDRQQAVAAARRHRATPFTSTATGSLWQWQWLEAGASLAPRHLAPLLLVILLVPRGPAMMVLPALALVTLTASINGWVRAVNVIVAAHAWLQAEPVAPRRWLPQALRLPLLTLVAAAMGLGILGWLAAAPLLAGVAVIAPLAFGTLYLAVVSSGRAAPQRIPLRLTLHALLLVAIVQVMAPLALPLWVMQIVWLTRGSLRQ